MHTCYSPVRQSPAESASTLPAALRLACVKPAASVHPEPGSNSPLLFIYCYIFQCLSVGLGFLFIARRLTGLFIVPVLFQTTFAALSCSKISMFSCIPEVAFPLALRLACGVVVSVLRVQSYNKFQPCANFVHANLKFSRLYPSILLIFK